MRDTVTFAIARFDMQDVAGCWCTKSHVAHVSHYCMMPLGLDNMFSSCYCMTHPITPHKRTILGHTFEHTQSPYKRIIFGQFLMHFTFLTISYKSKKYFKIYGKNYVYLYLEMTKCQRN